MIVESRDDLTGQAGFEELTLVDRLIAEQQRLTPVAKFARKHDAGHLPAQERYYRDLIPQNRPAAGEQYAFAVDLDACTGCKACVAACHSLNGLDDEETWRSVGFLHGRDSSAPFQQTVTTACHHCVEPGCLEGCPVMAYEKDRETGIVRHLDDQCIGCQYCVLKCPYDVPKYSRRLGIVRKCDMCIDRLAAGEAPACVQACPTSAIRIEVVKKAEILTEATPESELVPGAFDSSYTKPSTRYYSERGLPKDVVPADANDLRLEHPHWPLIGMLLLTQTAAGLAVVHAAAASAGLSSVSSMRLSAAMWMILNAGLAVSVLHLGRPLGAWRFFLGLRTSWMSREILAFTAFALSATATLCTAIIPSLRDLLALLAPATAAVALVAVFTSAMIYVDTRRPSWRAAFTLPQFFGSTVALGTAAAAALLPEAGVLSVLALAARAALHLWETSTLRGQLADPGAAAHRSALTVARLLPKASFTRRWLTFVSIFASVAVTATSGATAAVFAAAALSAGFGAQLIERYAFFVASPAPRMPGGVPV